jgi:cysteine synthase
MNSEQSRTLGSIVDAIGQTPLVSLERITRNLDGQIFAKLEMLNPGLSKKDRAAKQIVLDARECGRLAPGQAVVELTSGNMGTGLAITCAILGHPFIAVMSKGNSEERARMMRALGAEVIIIDQAPGSLSGEVSGEDLALVEKAANEVAEKRGALRTDQFSLVGNANSHYIGTAPEIVGQTNGKFDAFCDFVGSGGTFAGCTRYFKEYRADIRCYIVEPRGASALAGERVLNPNHPIQGGGYSKTTLPLLQDVIVDDFISVESIDAINCCRRLAREEGIFAGYSSGANLAAALQLLEGPEKGNKIVMIVCDSGLKYLSTDLFDAEGHLDT